MKPIVQLITMLSGALLLGSNSNIVLAVGENTTSPVPEPATMLLLGVGLIALAGFSRRNRNKHT